MITSNGGVFGRNPKFNTVTTQGGIVAGAASSVAGNLTLTGGDLVIGTSGRGISFAATSDPTIPAVAAIGTITRTATNVSDGDTVTVGSETYTFKTTLTPADYEVLISAVDAAGSLTNLANAINGTGGSPGDYQVPAANASASAGTIVGSVLPLTALTAGTAGNSIALAETSAQLSVSGAAFTGGVNARGATGEVLDDYETGLWTPGLTSATVGDLFVRYTQRRGAYVKIGRSVTVHGVLACVPTYSTASGQLRLTGLPYASATGTDVPNEWPGFVSYMQNVTATNWVNAGIAAVQGQTYSLITGSVSASSVVVSSITDIASGSTFFISYTVTYLVP